MVRTIPKTKAKLFHVVSHPDIFWNSWIKNPRIVREPSVRGLFVLPLLSERDSNVLSYSHFGTRKTSLENKRNANRIPIGYCCLFLTAAVGQTALGLRVHGLFKRGDRQSVHAPCPCHNHRPEPPEPLSLPMTATSESLSLAKLPRVQ